MPARCVQTATLTLVGHYSKSMLSCWFADVAEEFAGPIPLGVRCVMPWTRGTHHLFSLSLQHRVMTTALLLKRLMPVRDLRRLLLQWAFGDTCRVVGVATQERDVELFGHVLRVRVIDEGPQEEWRSTDCFGVCYSVADNLSFDAIMKWYNPLVAVASPEARLMLIGLTGRGQRCVSQKQGFDVAHRIGAASFMECDASLSSIAKVWETLVHCPLDTGVALNRGIMDEFHQDRVAVPERMVESTSECERSSSRLFARRVRCLLQ
jgi:hypothetical protein